MTDSDLALLQRAIEIAKQARAHGNHPFGALLADRNGNILLEAENSVVTEHDCTGHAETNLMRLASRRFEPDFLANCTLYTSTEPCAMCAGAIYWGNVGRVVFAMSEEDLLVLTGDNPENQTFSLPCREVFARGQRPVIVEGPALQEEARQAHAGFWQ
ncbi:MAG: nucleoside deaminase [Anaerolineae bacterium]